MDKKKYISIDGIKIQLEGEKNLLEVVRKAGVQLPTFCYHSQLSTYGACRMCVVENERGSVMASCSTIPEEGMIIKTNTKKLINYRRMILELILANHCGDCTVCEKNDACELRILASKMGVYKLRFENNREIRPLDESGDCFTRDVNKCILCGDCVRTCAEKQCMGVIDFAYRGSEVEVMPAFNRKISETNCLGCGRCVAVCPTGALVVKDDTQKVWDILHDPKKRVVAQFAPAVRVALGDDFNMPVGSTVTGKAVAAMRRIGFDEVYDTSLGADLTVVEEAAEFVNRLENGGKFPMFTSCCPAWVKYVEAKRPELLDHISSCKSPMQMLASACREYFKDDERETVMVAVMPCTAKKGEAARAEFKHDGKADVEICITTQELAYMINEAGIDFANLDPESPDMPFGMASGSGVIFGVTGGVAEAVIRRVSEDKTAEALKEISYVGVRGAESIKEATIKVGDQDINIAVVHGMVNLEEVLSQIQSGEKMYHLIEVMTCPEGCINGAGQPICKEEDMKLKRAKGLYTEDNISQLKWSEQNPMVKNIYKQISTEKAHELFHVHYEQK